MTDAPRPSGRRGLPRFLRDERGVSAVEFAIVCGPFLAVVIYILQLSVYYLTQSALDAGVIRSADALRNGFSYATTPAMPSGADLKAFVARNSGAVIANDATLAVEIRPLGGLASALVSLAAPPRSSSRSSCPSCCC